MNAPVRKTTRLLMLLILMLAPLPDLLAEDGNRMWLRYVKVASQEKLSDYRDQIRYVVAEGDSPTLLAARDELERGLSGLLDRTPPFRDSVAASGGVLIGTPESSDGIASLDFEGRLRQIGDEGYLIEEREVDGETLLVIAANEEIGVLYGVFHLLRLIQTEQPLHGIEVLSAPRSEEHTSELQSRGHLVCRLL